jgi:integrase
MSAMPRYSGKTYAGINLKQLTAQSPKLPVVLALAAANTRGKAGVFICSRPPVKPYHAFTGGSMPRMKLTERSIARLAAPAPSGRQTVYWDADLRGFGVLVSGRTTVKSFIVQRDLAGGKTRRVTIASVAELSLSEARDRARPLLVTMRGGKDPKAKTSGTLQETAELYLQSARLSPRSKEIYAAHLRLHLAPLKDRHLASITPQEIDALHNRIVGRSAANAAIITFRLLYNWAAARDDTLPRNPVRLRKNEWHRTEPRRRPIPPEKLATFYDAAQTLSPMLRDFVVLALFTGMRRREAAALRWTEVDFARRLIALPATRTKTRTALDIPMCDVVHDLLVARRQLGDGVFVFPSHSRSGHLEHVSIAVKVLGQKIGFEFSMHDLRRTFITPRVWIFRRMPSRHW